MTCLQDTCPVPARLAQRLLLTGTKQHDKRSVESPRLELYKTMMCLQLFKESMLARAVQQLVQDAWRRKQNVCPPTIARPKA